MHAADKGVGAVPMLRMKSNPLPEAAREKMVCADIAVWNTRSCCDTVQVGQNVFLDLATDRHTASLPHENHDTSRPLYLEHERSIQYVGRHHDCRNVTECDAQFEQHRKVHLMDETCCSYVCLSVFHVDLCGRAVHDFDGTLHAELRHSVTAFRK